MATAPEVVWVQRPSPIVQAAAEGLRARLNAAWAAQGRPQLGVGIGLSHGEAFAGNIGSERRLEYTVIGDPVNEAARLTELAKDHAGRAVASGATMTATASLIPGGAFALLPGTPVELSTARFDRHLERGELPIAAATLLLGAAMPTPRWERNR